MEACGAGGEENSGNVGRGEGKKNREELRIGGNEEGKEESCTVSRL